MENGPKLDRGKNGKKKWSKNGKIRENSLGHCFAIFAPVQLVAVFHFDFHFFFPFRLVAVFHAMPARQDPKSSPCFVAESSAILPLIASYGQCSAQEPCDDHHSATETRHSRQRTVGASTRLSTCSKQDCRKYPLIKNDYRQEKIIFELFSGALQENPVRAPGPITGGGSYRTGAHTGDYFWGIIGGGSTGKSCNSPGAIT